MDTHNPKPVEERRQYPNIREIFAEACALILPFFSSENRWANETLDHLAYRVVREHYPDLSPNEVHVLVTAARRIHAGDRPMPA